MCTHCSFGEEDHLASFIQYASLGRCEDSHICELRLPILSLLAWTHLEALFFSEVDVILVL